MANKHDSFDMDKWSKGKKEKKEKPIKEEKEPKIKLSDDSSFDFDRKMKREKVKKAPKEKEVKLSEGSFEIGGKEKPLKEPKGRKVREDKSFEMDNGDKSFDMEEQKNKKLDFKSLIKKKWFWPSAIAALLAIVAIVTLVVVTSLSNGNVDSDPIKEIVIKSTPEKTVYLVGDEAVYYGLEVVVIFKDATTLTIGPKNCQFTGFDSSVAVENQRITVTYAGHSTTFNISIKNGPGGNNPGNSDPNNPNEPGTNPNEPVKFNGLSFKSYPKQEYKVGERLSIKGGVLLYHYSDGSTKEIELTYDHVTNFDSGYPGVYEVQVMHIEDGFYAVTTYTITVTE